MTECMSHLSDKGIHVSRGGGGGGGGGFSENNPRPKSVWIGKTIVSFCPGTL